MDNVWKARITRRFISASVRSFLRKDILKLVSLNIKLPLNSGCVIVICHTPWKRLLIQWCLEQKNIQVIAAIGWTGKRRSIQNTATGFKELKKAITYLRQNGRIIITLDIFNKLEDCPVTFLGVNENVSMFPVRLAQLGQVPLIMAIPVYDEGVVKFIKGPIFNPQDDNLNFCAVMQCLIHDLEQKIKTNPSVWSEHVR